MSDEVTDALAAMDAECYPLRLKAPVALMEAFVKAKNWIQNAAHVRVVGDQERQPTARWDAYQVHGVQDGPIGLPWNVRGSELKNVKVRLLSAAARSHQSLLVTAAREEYLRSSSAADTVHTTKAEFAEHVLRFRDLESLMAPIKKARAK